ncbi:RDD family protein [Motiliproteus sediminis]|uniref:RDD family protein n=1 Tax=Motiliproteus sediminis TaxID=1468178 RepID=UPI001AEF6C20|nr:RDD family protein [Motiliproteus sediminis]
MPNAQSLPVAPLWRRLAAMTYDSLLIVALWMMVGAIGVALNGGEEVGGPFFNSTLFLITFLFFGVFWTRSGQTLGMMAWRLRVESDDGRGISWMQALLRFFTAGLSALVLGLGYWWMLIDKQQRTWQDRYSETRVVVLPKRSKK